MSLWLAEHIDSTIAVLDKDTHRLIANCTGRIGNPDRYVMIGVGIIVQRARDSYGAGCRIDGNLPPALLTSEYVSVSPASTSLAAMVDMMVPMLASSLIAFFKWADCRGLH